MKFTDTALFIILILLIIASSFFSGSETSMMAVNRFRLKFLVKRGIKPAIRVYNLLKRPDKLLGVILIGNTITNLTASSLATLLALKYFGEIGVAISTAILSLLILIFAETIPKTLAALFPDKLAFIICYPLRALLYIFYPFVLFITFIGNSFLNIFNIDVDKLSSKRSDNLSTEELHSIVHEMNLMSPNHYNSMLLQLMSLKMTAVEDVMIPRHEIIGINLQDDWQKIKQQILNSEYLHLIVYDGDINKVTGFVQTQQIIRDIISEEITLENLKQVAKEILFVPINSRLSDLLINFQQKKQRLALAVDEYGDIHGLINLEDILEEVFGEVITNDFIYNRDIGIYIHEDNSYIVNATKNIRDINRYLSTNFSEISVPNTLSGLIIEYLEYIPKNKLCLKLSGYLIEVLRIQNNTIKLVKIHAKTLKKI